MARCGDRVPRWPRTGWVHTGGLVPWGPAGPAPGRDFPRGCTVEVFGVLCAPQVMHSASGVCPLPRPSMGSRGHGWAGHPHVPHPEHPEPPVTGRHWGPAPSLHPGVGVPAASPLPRPFTAPICFSLGNCSRSPKSSRTLAQSRVAQRDVHAWTSPGTTCKGTVAGPQFVPSTPACHPGGSCPSRCHRALCDGP